MCDKNYRHRSDLPGGTKINRDPCSDFVVKKTKKMFFFQNFEEEKMEK